jgi:hypothetical protein
MGLLTVLKKVVRKVAGDVVWKTKRILYKIQGKRIVHVLHIGKTGGTALKNALEPFLVNDSQVICLHSHECKLSEIPLGEGVVFFLRDPLARFVSGFYSRLRQGQPKYFFPWNADEQTAFDYFDSPNKLAVCLSSENGDVKRAAHKAMNSIAHVKSHYWDWFGDEQYFLSRSDDIVFIGFQEHLDEDFKRLKSTLGIPNDAKLPVDDVLAHRNPVTVDRFLEPEAVKNLMDWYQEDFRCIAICHEIIRSVSSLNNSEDI